MTDQGHDLVDDYGERIDFWAADATASVSISARELARLRFLAKQARDAHDLLDEFGIPDRSGAGQPPDDVLALSERIKIALRTGPNRHILIDAPTS